ncbi:HAMP domain-containing histidine kinase [Oscillatoriales cyanobacterium LEGE 11467]|uniref:histidine kinase n=1 Tax=Zarconia navalis LEGE 11467 TaxID=1828826 RepID=A0A928W173_9CYAN|nr:HAMP domain-containing sensor histidine kinase [Zarconia navalis]MBE9042076.1 HAMP domain-containing histidine kinase [Zarconia navalis LEGE 11467]
MSFVTFILGLAVGMSFFLWLRFTVERQLRQLLASLDSSIPDDSMSLWSQLRRGIAVDRYEREDLERSVEYWQQILLDAPFGYLQVDEDNQLCWCNDKARSLLKIDRWNSGDSCLLLKLVRSYELDRAIELTRERQQPKQRDWTFHPVNANVEKPKLQDSLALRSHTFPLADGYVGVFLENRQPITDLARSRDRWLSDLTHELRTPLTSVRLVVEALQSRVEPSVKKWVDRLLEENDRLIKLVGDWLELSQLETNPSDRLNCKDLELESLVRSVWQTLEPLAQPQQINLICSIPTPCRIEADKSKLYRVFLNLLDNSLRHSPPKAAIEVEVLVPEGNRLEINIIDAGSGFSELDLPHLFERFYRGDPSRTREANSTVNGSGLGLAIVQQIVTAHGGSVVARNHPETGGAWVQIKLPIKCIHS